MKRTQGVSYKHETGLTMISIVFILILIGFFALLILKIAPIYMENYQVKSMLASLEKEPLTSQSKQAIKTLLSKRFNINNINKVSVNDDVVILKRPEFVTVTIDYEVVEPIMGNLEVLVYFTEEITVKKK